MRTLDLVRRAYDRLESDFESAVSRGAEKRSRPFYEYANGKVLLDSESVNEARGGESDRQGEGDFFRNVCDSFLETGNGRLVPALTFNKDAKPIIIVVIQP